MRDPYLGESKQLDRLISEWIKYGRLVIAYDFDNTVHDYHQEGHVYEAIPQLLRKCKALGAYLYVFTCRGPEAYERIEYYLRENDIPFDAINKAPDDIQINGGKPYYNILLDDRAGLYSAYQCLLRASKLYYDYTVKRDEMT